MSISSNMETQASSMLDKYGNAVTIQKQTATYDSYSQAYPNWANSTTVSANAIIIPFSPRSTSGEEYHNLPVGILQETEYVGFFKATETLEESTDGTTAIRYIITHNSINYEILKIFTPEIQDNVILKRCYLKKITT